MAQQQRGIQNLPGHDRPGVSGVTTTDVSFDVNEVPF
jgi:hypothetical protein